MAARGLLARGVPKTLPRFLLFIKIAILVLALIVLALSAFAISIFANYDDGYYYVGTGAPGLLIFVAIKTLIVYGLVTAIQIWAPRLFFRIAALIAYLLGIIFWLASWAWAASVSGAYFSLANLYGNSRAYGDFGSKLRQEGGAMAGCAAIGAIAWILSIVNVVFFIKACLSDPDSEVSNNNPQQQAELGQVPPKAHEAHGPVDQQQYQQAPYQQAPYQQAPQNEPAPYGQPAPDQQSPYGQPQQQQQQQPMPYGQPAPGFGQATPQLPQPYVAQ